MPTRDLSAKSELLLATPLPGSNTEIPKDIGYHHHHHRVASDFYVGFAVQNKYHGAGKLVYAPPLFPSLQH